MNKRYLSVHQK